VFIPVLLPHTHIQHAHTNMQHPLNTHAANMDTDTHMRHNALGHLAFVQLWEALTTRREAAARSTSKAALQHAAPHEPCCDTQRLVWAMLQQNASAAPESNTLL